MRILVTGAAGFLGRVVVRRLLEQGHDVTAFVRPMSDAGYSGPSLSVIRGDLRQKGAWRDQVADIDVVIHLAAATSGDLAEQFASSVVATENLLQSLSPDRLRRFVLVSSFSVYGFADIPAGSVLNESAPLESRPEERDAYTWTKLIQEDLVRQFCRKLELPLVVVRPGAIYGPGKNWSFGSAISLGAVELVFSPFARFRLTHVENCADAIAMAATTPEADGQTFNVVDDRPPTHFGFRRMCRRAGAPAPFAIYVPWFVVVSAGWLLRQVNRGLLGNRARLPEFLDYRRQQARWKPLGYSNARLKRRLGWVPRKPVEEGVRELVAPLSAGETLCPPHPKCAS